MDKRTRPKGKNKRAETRNKDKGAEHRDLVWVVWLCRYGSVIPDTPIKVRLGDAVIEPAVIDRFEG